MSSGGNGNGTSSNPYYFSSGSPGRITSFGYGVGISAGILILVVTITLMSFFCLRTSSSAGGRAAVQPPSRRQRPEEEEEEWEEAAMVDVEAVGGLDEQTLASYPKVTYAEAKGGAATSTASSCCSICLADYSDVDTLRLLPECGHLFHVDCIDPWLKSRPTCPICRASPVPSPLPTPLAEVVPLAMARRSQHAN